MARMTEIVKENLEFYCNTYYQSIEKTARLYSYIYIFITGFLTWVIKNMVLRGFYFQEAGIKGTDGEEVMDYIVSEMGNYFFDKYTIVILFGCILLGICMFTLHKFVKNYEMYKRRWLVTLIPFAISVAELVILCILFIRERGMIGIPVFQWKALYNIVLLLLIMIPKVFSGRLLMTLELRKADESIIIKFFDLLTDWVLEKM